MDLIDRQAVEKIIDDLLEDNNLQASPSVWHGLHMIKQLPSAQPERKGKWIVDGEPPWLVKQCSLCGTKFFHTSGGILGNYCSECGADMRGEDHETD